MAKIRVHGIIVEKGIVGSDGTVVDISSWPKKITVPILKEFQHGNVIGEAVCKKTLNGISADFEIDEKYLPLYPSIGGKIIKDRIESGIRYIDEFELTSVSLNTSPNQDPEIKNVEEQIKKRCLK